MDYLHTNFSIDNASIVVEGNITNKEYLSTTNENYYLDNKTGSDVKYRNGKLRNLIINENLNHGTTIIKGSLTAYFNNGSNFNSISLDQLPNAYIKLGRILGLDPDKVLDASIIAGIRHGFEYGVSFEVNQPPQIYTSSCLDMKGQNQKSLYEETVYFINKSMQFYFYDKGKQLKEKDVSGCEKLYGKCILRIEKRITCGTTLKALTGDKLKVRDFSSANFKRSCIVDFLKSYHKVTIRGVASDKNMNKLTLEEIYMLKHPVEAMEALTLFKKEKTISDSSYYSKKKKIKEMASNAIEVNRELDTKLEEIYNNFTSSI